MCDVSKIAHLAAPGLPDYKEFHQKALTCPVRSDIEREYWYWTRQKVTPALIVTARSDEYLWETQQWLGNNGITYAGLFMRQAHDSRSDVLVKEDLLQLIIHDWGYNPVKAWDDNPAICDMYELYGIETVLVQPLPTLRSIA